MKKATIIIIIVEIGIVAGIILAAVILPRSTPLWHFVTVSAATLAFGNYLLFRKLNRARSGPSDSGGLRRSGSSRLLLAAAAILLLLYLVNKL